MAKGDFKRKVDRLTGWDIVAETDAIINENQEFINDLIRAQLAEGKDAYGEPVTIFGRDFYSDRTVFDKEHGNYPPLGKLTAWVTNYLNGNFYAMMRTEAVGRVFKTFSEVSYFEEIIERSGDKIMKLSKEHRLIFEQEILKPELVKRFLLL